MWQSNKNCLISFDGPSCKQVICLKVAFVVGTGTPRRPCLFCLPALSWLFSWRSLMWECACGIVCKVQFSDQCQTQEAYNPPVSIFPGLVSFLFICKERIWRIFTGVVCVSATLYLKFCVTRIHIEILIQPHGSCIQTSCALFYHVNAVQSRKYCEEFECVSVHISLTFSWVLEPAATSNKGSSPSPWVHPRAWLWNLPVPRIPHTFSCVPWLVKL